MVLCNIYRTLLWKIVLHLEARLVVVFCWYGDTFFDRLPFKSFTDVGLLPFNTSFLFANVVSLFANGDPLIAYVEPVLSHCFPILFFC